MNQAIVERYDSATGEQTRGYNKILSSVQVYEEILLDFEKHVCRKYSEALDNCPEPTWWQRTIREMDKEDLLLTQNDQAWALDHLYRMIVSNTLVNDGNWIFFESIAFNGKVDVAQYYETYDNLRNIIRCGSTFLIDDTTAQFINKFNKRLTIFC